MARRDDESKQGLTIALVLFVLLSLILGLMAYFGYADQAALSDDKRKLEARVKLESIERDRWRLRYSVHLVANGAGNAKEEAQALADIQALKARGDKTLDGKEIREEYKDELDKLTKKGVKWDEFSQKPDNHFSGIIAQMQKDLDTARKLDRDKSDAFKKATDEYQQNIAAMRDAKNKAEQFLAMTKDDVDKRIKGIDDNYKETVKKFEENIIAAEKFAEALAKKEKEKQEIEAKLMAALKDAEIKIEKISEKLPQYDILAYDKPKGRITKIDINNQTAYINLGSADLVKPGLTFSIFGVGQYKPNAEAKGRLEVINVIGDHLASARITEMRLPTRDPAISGDELYNPAWSPGFREHVAVAGMIDLTGDGRDGTLEFVKNLEKQGVVVDAYLDTRDLTVKGKGITRQTSYLVLGEVPQFEQQEQIREGDARQERKMGINTEMTKMREEANRLGVQVVPARRFMTLMGYKVPRVPARTEDWNAYTIRQSGVGADGKMMPKEMGKDMKKDEMKKDEMKKDNGK